MSASRAFWGRLSDEEKKMFSDTAIEAMKYQKALSREKNDQIIDEFKEKMEVSELSAEQIQTFRDAVQPVYDEYEELVGLELLRAFGYKK
jgi:TRAP-type C4-dicarboxylate transport system substrate-binding protein